MCDICSLLRILPKWARGKKQHQTEDLHEIQLWDENGVQSLGMALKCFEHANDGKDGRDMALDCCFIRDHGPWNQA
jgi:hypothetical protein